MPLGMATELQPFLRPVWEDTARLTLHSVLNALGWSVHVGMTRESMTTRGNQEVAPGACRTVGMPKLASWQHHLSGHQWPFCCHLTGCLIPKWHYLCVGENIAEPNGRYRIFGWVCVSLFILLKSQSHCLHKLIVILCNPHARPFLCRRMPWCPRVTRHQQSLRWLYRPLWVAHDRHFCASDVPIKISKRRDDYTNNLVASRLREIAWEDVLLCIETVGPGLFCIKMHNHALH